MDMIGTGGILYILFLAFAVVLAILWVLMPFAVFGTKDRLDTSISEARASNKALKDLARETAALRAAMEGRGVDRPAG